MQPLLSTGTVLGLGPVLGLERPAQAAGQKGAPQLEGLNPRLGQHSHKDYGPSLTACTSVRVAHRRGGALQAGS